MKDGTIFTRSPVHSEKLEVIDKWRSRVLFTKKPNHNTEESWTKKIEKQIAILRVTFPFLTDGQIRGKAWQSYGLTSVMGGLPRSGLSPQQKREFFKYKNHSQARMPRKLRAKKESTKLGKDFKPASECLYTFNSPNMQLASLKNSSKVDYMESLHTNLTQMSGVQIFSRSSAGSGYKNSIQFGSTRIRNSLMAQEADEVSYKMNSPYCSQSLKIFKKVNDPESLDIIIPSLAAGSICYTQTKISECTTTDKSDGDKTVSGFDRVLDNSRTPSQLDNPFSQCSNNVSPNTIIYNPFLQDPLMQEEIIIPRVKEGYCTPINQIISNKGTNPFMQHFKKSSLSNSEEDMFSSPPLKKARISVENECFTPVSTKKSMKKFSDINNGNTLSYHEEVKQLQNELDSYIAELNPKLPEYQTSLSYSNNYSTAGQTTPVRNTKFDEAKKKITFETVAEVHHRDSSIVQKYEAINSLKDQLSPVDMTLTQCVETETFEKVILRTVEVMSAHESSGSNFSTVNNPDMNDLHMEDVIYDPSQIPIHEIEVMSIDFDENESVNSGNHTANEDEKSKIDMKEYNSQTMSISLPLTPVDSRPVELPPSVLLSNFCSEYDRAYAKKDLKPVLYRNYYSDKTDIAMNDYFDQIIPPEQTLTEFFNAPGKGFKKVKKSVTKAVNNIILMLEQEDHTEDSVTH